LFLEESVQALVEAGALVGERGAYRLDRPLDAIRVPATVQAVLAARIDRLPPEDKRLLQTAAVIGKDVPFALLQAIADTPETDLQAGLSRLQAAELLYAVSLFPDLELTFKHALTHEVAYGGLLQERRRALHARIVDAIERLYTDRLDEHTERLAHHALSGQVWEKAVDYYRQAGLRAMARSAYPEARRFLEQALEAFAHLPDDPAWVPVAIDLRFDLRTTLTSLQLHQNVREHVDAAVALAEAIGDRARLGRGATYQAHYLRATVDHRRAVEAGDRAAAIGVELGDLRLQVAAIDVARSSAFEMGAHQGAIDRLRSNVALLSGDLALEMLGQSQAPAITSRGYLALSLAWLGDFPEAIRVAEEAVQIAEAIAHEWTMRSAYLNAGLVYSLHGDVARAIPRLEQGDAIARKLGIGNSIFLANGYTQAGRAEEAIPLFERGIQQAASTGWLPCVSLWTGWQAAAYLGGGRIGQAEQTAIQAVEMARTNTELGFEAEAHYQLGEVALQIEPFDPTRPEQHFRDALAIAEELGMRPLQAHCRLGLGKLHRRAGRPEDARSELNQAIDLYLSMEMRHWLPEAESELAAVD
jgi:tetratricopeptide (TPR) repeat protein